MYRIVIVLAVFALFVATAYSWTDVRVNQDGGTVVQNEPSICINQHYTSDPLNIIVGYNDIGNTLGVSYSTDGGSLWFDVNLPYVWANTGDPSVACDPGGTAWACFLSYEGPWFTGVSGIYVCTSHDGGRTWGSPATVDELKYTGGAPVKFADKCFMTVDTNQNSPNIGNIYVGWQRDDTNGTNSDVFFSRSVDGGLTFSPPIQINDNPPQTAWAEGAFPFVGANGLVYMTWYDCYFKGGVPGSLYVDMSFDGGQTFGGDKKVANFLAPPHYTADCSGFRVKSFPSAAADPNDMQKLYITYVSDSDGYEDIRLDVGNDPGQHQADRPAIERNGSFVYSAWEDFRNGAGDIYFNRSTDNGQTWELAAIGPLDNGDTPGLNNSWWVRMSSSGNNVYVVWEDYRSTTHSDVYFNRSTDNGLTWQSDQHIDGNTTTNSGAPHIVSSGSNVYVAFQDFRNGMDDIYLARSTDFGASWQPAVRVDLGDSPGATSSFSPRLACTGSYVYCYWIDWRPYNTKTMPYFNYSADFGASWQPTSVNLSSGTTHSLTQLPLRDGIECTGNLVYAAFNDDRSGATEVYFNRSTNNGASWVGDMVINEPVGNCYDAEMNIQGNYVYIGWEDNRLTGAGTDIFFDYSSDNGVTWQTPDIGPLDVSSIGIVSVGVDIKSEGSYVYATWYDGSLGGQIFFNRSTDNGQNWGADELISMGTLPYGTGMVQPVMDAGNGWVNIAWPDPRCVYMGMGLQDIFSNYSSDNGATWLSGSEEADVFCVRSTDAGVTWQSPVTVSDNPELHPDVLPWVAVKSNGIVDIAYYQFQSSPMMPPSPASQVRMSVSMDGGATFNPSFLIQDMEVPPNTRWVGEYIGIAVKDSFAYTVFTDLQQTGNSDIFIDRVVNPDLSGYVCGDANNSSAVDIDDAVYLIAYIFTGGPAPIPYAAGDANCSGAVDIDDVVWLIAYIFTGGYDPCDTSGDGIPDC